METFVSKVHVKQPVSVLSLVCEREQTGQLFFFLFFFVGQAEHTHTHYPLLGECEWDPVPAPSWVLPQCSPPLSDDCVLLPGGSSFKKPRHVAAVLTYYRHQNHGGLFKENLKKASF